MICAHGNEGRRNGLEGGRRWLGWLLAGLTLWRLGWFEAYGQLAITEVMSWASIIPGTSPLVRCPDFWVLKNFGDNAMDLNGYRFKDREHPWMDPDSYAPFVGLTIEARESIVFVRNQNGGIGTFISCWFPSGPPLGLRITDYASAFGFDDRLDAVVLADANGNLVDRVELGQATEGVTFTYDPTCGTFGALSRIDFCGAFQGTYGDTGSPGVATCGPVPLSITEQPVSLALDAGLSETFFSVQACGLPKPRYKWRLNGTNLSNEGAFSGTVTSGTHKAFLIIDTVRPEHAGQYTVEVDNGLERVISLAATLSVNTNPSVPNIVCPPLDLKVAPGQTASFKVMVSGWPLPTLQWQANGVDIPSATNRVLVVNNASTSMSGTVFSVRVANELGSTRASATLLVERQPRLAITEAMVLACTTSGVPVGDCWELTNLDTNAVNLRGITWDDAPGEIGQGPTIAQEIIQRPGQCPEVHGYDVILQPGESAILVEGLTPEQFIAWWGADNLPSNLKIIPYVANGLNEDQDEIIAWTGTATDTDDFIDSVCFANIQTEGVSLWFAPSNSWFLSLCQSPSPETNYWGAVVKFGVLAVPGDYGAFHAAQGCDIGSPGWTPWTPPQITSIRREVNRVMLAWKAQPGSTNVVQYRSNASEGPWTTLGSFTSAGATRTATDTSVVASTNRFYRVVCFPNCPCYEPPP